MACFHSEELQRLPFHYVMINSNAMASVSWMSIVELAIPLVFCLFVIYGLPRLSLIAGLLCSFGLLSVFVWAHQAFGFFSQFGWGLLLPVGVIVVGHILAVSIPRLKRKKQDTQSAAIFSGTDKNLGLYYQQQGMLDLAFHKLRSLPMEDDTKDLLYDLALEFEKKNQIRKAFEVCKVILERQMEGEALINGLSMQEHAPSRGKSKSPKDDDFVGMGSAQEKKWTIGPYDITGEMERDSTGIFWMGWIQKQDEIYA